MSTMQRSAIPLDTQIIELPVPDEAIETPCFVVLEDAVEHNIRTTIEKAGGAGRLMPHVKTHRAPWIVALHIRAGISAFKCATPVEVEMCLAAGATNVLWAYPTANGRAISRVMTAARKFPKANVIGLVDSSEGMRVWLHLLMTERPRNVGLMVDIDPGMGRTGVPIGVEAENLARSLEQMELFKGWHVYDGHIQDRDPEVRLGQVTELAEIVGGFLSEREKRGVTDLVVAAGSWTYDLWPHDIATQVSPGSYVYSSTQHQSGLPEHSWRIGAYVLASVVSTCGNTATLDAGSKAIAPDMKVHERFLGAGEIKSIKEEHSIVSGPGLQVGMNVPLVPRHTCTTAYLYQSAIVLALSGKWETRPQMGNLR